ncbi:MAG: hypothetical protein AABZ74_09980 [Cyanobacteriota bacterium]
MDYKEKLVEIYQKSKMIDSSKIILNEIILDDIDTISKKSFVQKGVFTVLVTLFIYKIFNKNQDIRKHQSQIEGGFSGRTIDYKYITPTLKEIGLPSMAESGWLTRSLEQPYPYNLDYNGKISDKNVKKSFLNLINSVEEDLISPEEILILIFKNITEIQKKDKIKIKPINNPEILTIDKIIELLDKQFSYKYDTFGGSKLPVIAFYSIYKILINEISRYNSCSLGNLSSHTASDKTSKSSGDIEIFRNGKLFESIEIKLDKEIDSNILRIAKEKIVKFNPERYYILSYYGISKNHKEEILKIIDDVKLIHGCQIIVNGVLPSLKYYLRLLSKLEDFFNIYSNLIEIDKELKAIHKKQFIKFIEEIIE